VTRRGRAPAGKEVKRETKLGLTAKKAEDFGAWYSEVVVEGELISYYDVSGRARARARRRRMSERGAAAHHARR
jgi:hypothetical protein